GFATFDQDWSPLRGGGRTFRWNSIWWASPMYFDSEGNIKPYVFTSWESADNTVWTFKTGRAEEGGNEPAQDYRRFQCLRNAADGRQ
ncbi:hypothetical protein ACCS56_37355, partial [Rhizobium ruizarguesonis]